MTTRAQIIAAAKESGFGDYAHEALTMFERFYTIAFNAGYRSFCDEICEKCGQTRQQVGGGCIHCITEWCKQRVKKAEVERDELKSTIALYEQALKASWPEGARGEAFDHWNAARKIISKGEKE